MPPPTPPDGVDLGRAAYAAYGEAVGGRNYRGEPMPAWDNLGHRIQAAWVVAAEAAVLAHWEASLARIEAGLTAVHRICAATAAALHHQGVTVSEIDDAIAAEAAQADANAAAEQAFDTDLARELADLTAAVAGKLTDAEKAAFAALAVKLQAAGQATAADQAAVDTADPQPAA